QRPIFGNNRHQRDTHARGPTLCRLRAAERRVDDSRPHRAHHFRLLVTWPGDEAVYFTLLIHVRSHHIAPIVDTKQVRVKRTWVIDFDEIAMAITQEAMKGYSVYDDGAVAVFGFAPYTYHIARVIHIPRLCHVAARHVHADPVAGL